jgi:nucleotide-binding universal stress UspA family protein
VYQNILLCYDGTAEGRRALRQGADVAMCMKSHAYLLAIGRSMLSTAIPEAITPELVNAEQASADQLLSEGVQWLRERGVSADGQLLYGNPMTIIPQVAGRINADLIVVGYRYQNRITRWWAEGEEATLLTRVHCSILVCMDHPAA